jgi:hypothetical protein
MSALLITDSSSKGANQIRLRKGKQLPPRKETVPLEKDREKESQPVALPPSDHVAPRRSDRGQADPQSILEKVDDNVLAHIKKIPCVYDALLLSSELRESLIKALQYRSQPCNEAAMVGADRKIKEAMAAGVTFSQKDMLLKSSDHNRPLYCKGKIDTLTVNRVLEGDVR